MKKLLFVLFLFLSACTPNFVAKFYQPNVPDARKIPGYDTSQIGVQIYSSDDTRRDVDALGIKGYVPIGGSSFWAQSDKVSKDQLIEQATLVGAHVVLFSTKYKDTVSGAVPLVLPNTTTSYSTGNATAYGTGGVVNVYGNATTTTYGSQTVMMPYSVNRSDYQIVYLAKRHFRFGARVLNTDDETRKRLQRNSGVIVAVVVEGSPAYSADILKGDIILSINNEIVQSQEHFMQINNKYPGGSTIALKIDRNGKIIQKEVVLASY